MYILLCVTDVCSAGPTVVFIVCHSVLSSQSIYVYTFILSLESLTTTCHTHIVFCSNKYVLLNLSMCLGLVLER